VTTPTVACSSTASSADMGLLAEVTGVLSDEAYAASNSSNDTSLSSASTPALTLLFSEKVLEIALASMELMSAAKSSAPEAVSAASAPALSLSTSSSTAPEESLLDDELSRSSYQKKKKRRGKP
jgi:hypothetical protein